MIKKSRKIISTRNKKLSNIHDLVVIKILVSKKESLKYFIGYNDDDDFIRPLFIKLAQMTGYAKHFDNNKAMTFKVIDNKLLKKYTKIWQKISNLMNVKFDCESVYVDNAKYIKTKTYMKKKLYEEKINTNFQGKNIPKENSSYKCLSLIMLDFVIRPNKIFYPQTLLEKCKYEIKNNKMENLINDDLGPSSSDESDNESIMNSIMDLIMRLIINFDNESDNDESNVNLLKDKTVF